MGGACGQGDAGIHRGARALVDQGVIPKYLHGLDGAKAGSGGRNIRRHMHRRRERGIVVRHSNSHPARAGEGGGQLIRRWGGFAGLEYGNGSYRKDEENAEDDILDETALEAGNSERVHRAKYAQIHLWLLIMEKAEFYLGRFLRERVINRDYKLSSSKTWKANLDKGD